MKLIFKNLGQHKVSKTVEIGNGTVNTSFFELGFDNVMDFIVAEARPHVPEEGALEAVPTDGFPPLLSYQYVIVYDGIRGVGSVTIQQ